METWYFTFGFGHYPYENCFTVIKANSRNEARDIMFTRFGQKWAFQYSEAQWFDDGVSQQEKWNLKEV